MLQKLLPYMGGAVIAMFLIVGDVYDLPWLLYPFFIILAGLMLVLGLWYQYLLFRLVFAKETATMNGEKIKRSGFTHYLFLVYLLAFGTVLPLSAVYTVYLMFTGRVLNII